MRLPHILQPRRRTVVAEARADDASAELARRMHAEFVRPDYIDRLAAFHGLGPADELTREHFASFDDYRRDVALRAMGDESSVDDGSSEGGGAGGGSSEEPIGS